jgi:hypothetical protein
MRKAAKPQVVGHTHTIDYPDKVAVVTNGRETPSGPPHKERRRLSLWQAVDWLLDELQRLARHSKIRDLEVPTTLEVVQAPAKRKPRRKRRQGLKSHKRAVRRS